jgi:hypothetical protein
MTSPLTELATATSRISRLLAETPAAHRPAPADVFHGLDAARAQVVELTRQGREDEARAAVADFEHNATSLVTARLVHAPLLPDPTT